jgi:periplasmic copper chaperone A
MTRHSTAALRAALLVLAQAVLAAGAQAHVGIEPPSATAGAYQRLAFKVGHGCEGSATVAITVQIPDGVIGAKPMPKPGWTVSSAEAKLATPVQSHGKSITSAVREITWRGGPLPDAWYDEFVMQVKLPDAPGRYAFKVAQVCEKGRMDWTEIPAAGARAERPAPTLDVVPPSVPAGADGMAGMAHHH